MSQPPTAFARGRVRQLFEQLRIEADRVLAAAAAIPTATFVAASSRSPVTRRRGVASVVRRMPVAPVYSTPTGAAWRLLRPVPALGAWGQPGVRMDVLLLGSPGYPAMVPQPFGAAFSAHSLARLIDRAGAGVDPLAAMLDAHDALMALPVAEGEQMFCLPDLPLRGGPGLFLCTPSRRDGAAPPMATARTWIASSQYWPDQDATAAAWGRLLAASAA